MSCHDRRSEAGAYRSDALHLFSILRSSLTGKRPLRCRDRPIFRNHSTSLLWAWSLMRTPELERSVLSKDI